MGSLVSYTLQSTLEKAEDKVHDVIMASKLMELKKAKRQRDVQLATQIARTRDIVLWMGGFFVVIGSTSAFKATVLRTGGLNISQFPFFAIPTMFLFQVHNETLSILRNEPGWWFNQPMNLPPYMAPVYRRLQDEHNAKLIAAGRARDKDWAKFDRQMTDEEIFDNTYFVTRSLAKINANS